MRLLAWNVQSGGAKRATAIVDFVRALEPDVLVLTEVRGASSSLLLRLADEGWRHQAVGENAAGRGAAAVLSRSPIERRTTLAEADGAFPGRWVEAEVPDAGLSVVGIYGPLREERFDDFWRSALAGLAERRDRPVVAAGDMNTGESLRDAPDRNFFCSAHFAAAKQLGYVDAWRETHGGAAREYSWYSRGTGGVQLNGFRLDHALLSPALAPRLRDARYVHEARERKLSDHSPLLVELAEDERA